MTDKLTPKSMEEQYEHQLETFKRKNHDYGNSFEKSLDTFGLVAGIVRMNDKFERLLSLTQGNKNALVGSESLVDTLEDLSNYAAMAACYLKGKKAEDWKNVRLKEIDHAIDATKIKAGISSRNGVSSFDLETGDIMVKPEKIQHPKQFILDVTKDIIATVRMKEKKNEFLVYMDISINLEPYLEEMRKRREKEVGEKTIDELLAEHNAALKKSRDDIDMMLDAMASGQLVSRVVDNGDGSFVAYWEKAGEEDDDCGQ